MEPATSDHEHRTGRRGRPSAADTRKRMAELLHVAREQFVRHGYRNTTMAAVATAAGLTKRTLYLWHKDKSALFRACVLEGVQRFPAIDDSSAEVAAALTEYLSNLIIELARESSNQMGRLLLREGSDFPEIAPVVARGHDEFIVKPLATYLRKQGMESPDSVFRTELLISMALSPVHNSLLLGKPVPSASEMRAHADQVVAFFLSCKADPLMPPS